MKLLTKEIRETLPALYSQEDNPDPLVRVHFFSPSGTGDWYVTEGGGDGDDFLFFGLGYIFEPEMGYTSLAEMESDKGPVGLGIERDLHWRPRPLSEVKAERGWT